MSVNKRETDDYQLLMNPSSREKPVSSGLNRSKSARYAGRPTHLRAPVPVPNPTANRPPRSHRTVKRTGSCPGDKHRSQLQYNPSGEPIECSLQRNFALRNGLLVNRGDSFRKQRIKETEHKQISPVSSRVSQEANQEANGLTRFTVLLVGESESGKTSFVRQVESSEYSNPFTEDAEDNDSEDSTTTTVTVSLQGETSELQFIKSSTGMTSHIDYDVLVFFYSVTHPPSFRFCLAGLSKYADVSKPVFLAANKIDLARQRKVSVNEGASAAQRHGAIYMEVSVALDHNIDELLLAILSAGRQAQRKSSWSDVVAAAQQRLGRGRRISMRSLGHGLVSNEPNNNQDEYSGSYLSLEHGSKNALQRAGNNFMMWLRETFRSAHHTAT